MVILAVILTLFSFVLYNNFKGKLFSTVNDYLESNALMVANSINNRWEKEKLRNFDVFSRSEKQEGTFSINFVKNIINWSKFEQSDLNYINTLVQVFDNKGKNIFSSKELSDIMVLSDEGYANSLDGKNFFENIAVELTPSKDMQMRFLTAPIFKEKKLLYIIRVGTPLITFYTSLNNLKLILLILLPVSLILTTIIGFFFAQITLTPVNQMIDTIHHITAENLNLRINAPKTEDELKRLADTFNDMLDRLDKSFSSQRRLIEDLSHEIKTPLSIIKGEIEVTFKKERTHQEYVEILESNLEEINRIVTIAENLLLVSRFESKAVKLVAQQINLYEVLTNILDDIKILTEEKNIALDLDLSKSISINGDPNQIKSLFLNLLDNAIKYTNDAGTIKVSLLKINNFAKIEIGDTGIGIPEDDLPYIFDRFYRVIRSSSKQKGFGLGLSIAKSIVDMHHGKIEVTSKPNKGTCIIIFLPVNT